MSNKLSVVIITFNEEQNIERCLKSVQYIADEIIVIDSFSTDKTEEICKNYNVKLHQEKWLGYSEQKNLANSLALHELIFSIDADESVSPELEKSILEIKKSATNNNAFKVKRLTNYCGNWIHHCGWYPDSKLRIWFKNEASWEGKIHETVKFHKTSPQITTLKGNLLHYSFYTIDDHINVINKFSSLKASNDFNNGKQTNFLKIIFKPVIKFIIMYLVKLGFLDGYYGYVVCKNSAFSEHLRQIKLKELVKNAN